VASCGGGGEQQDSSLLQTAGEESGERESGGKGMIDGRKVIRVCFVLLFYLFFLKKTKAELKESKKQKLN
jgi:hypothetical protein